jgi:hypothetical protein
MEWNLQAAKRRETRNTNRILENNHSEDYE